MRTIIFAAAMMAAFPAHAAYTIQISGTAVRDVNSGNGDASDVLAKYGSQITYTSTIEIDQGIYYPNFYIIAYSGKTISININGESIPVENNTPSVVNLENHIGSPTAAFWASTAAVNTGVAGFVGSLFTLQLPTNYGYDITNNYENYPQIGPFNVVDIVGEKGFARYSFSIGSFSVTGTQPTLTPYTPPPSPAPEPLGWAMIIAGFVFVGGALRHRRSAHNLQITWLTAFER